MCSYRPRLKGDSDIFMKVTYRSHLHSLCRIYLVQCYCRATDCFDIGYLHMVVSQSLADNLNILLNLSRGHLSDFIGSSVKDSCRRRLEVTQIIIFLK